MCRNRLKHAINLTNNFQNLLILKTNQVPILNEKPSMGILVVIFSFLKKKRSGLTVLSRQENQSGACELQHWIGNKAEPLHYLSIELSLFYYSRIQINSIAKQRSGAYSHSP